MYLAVVYSVAVPFSVAVFAHKASFPPEWVALTIASLFVATINVRLPRTSSVVVSMGDVFTLLTLMQFGPGPALITYWADTTVATVSDYTRRFGFGFLRRILVHRFCFNLANCAMSIWAMAVVYRSVQELPWPELLRVSVGLFLTTTTWFLANTVLLSAAVSLWNDQPYWTVWTEGIGLYLLNFFGSAASAGLVWVFYSQAGIYIFLFSLPIVVVLHQLYRFHIVRIEEAQNHIAQLNRLYLQTVEAMASAVDAKDRYTHGHIRRVQCYAVQLGRCLGIDNEKEVMAIRAGALLHDIGKIAIPEYILNKPTVLTEAEFERMKFHPLVGSNILQTIDFPYPVAPIVRSHHERWDGKGYPDGLSGEQIPLGARILSLVDCYDALTTDRPYRSPLTRAKIVELFLQESGKAYDPRIVDTFLANIESLESEVAGIETRNVDIWGLGSGVLESGGNIGKRERVEPVPVYADAVFGQEDVQRELCGLHEFARSAASFLMFDDILAFVGLKLQRMVDFDTAVFYLADLERGQVVAKHVVGNKLVPDGLTLSLDQKLSGWVAANSQALCNLPPFPDFLHCPEPKPQFGTSIVAPMTSRGVICGSIAVYRRQRRDFSARDFRLLEIVASLTATSLNHTLTSSSEILKDDVTGLPKSPYLHLIFDQVAADAHRYCYPIALISFQIENIRAVVRRHGVVSGLAVVRDFASFLRERLRDSDLIIRYSEGEFLMVCPRMNSTQSESLVTRIRTERSNVRCTVRGGIEFAHQFAVGVALYPDDGATLEQLLAVTDQRARLDPSRSGTSNLRRVPI